MVLILMARSSPSPASASRRRATRSGQLLSAPRCRARIRRRASSLSARDRRFAGEDHVEEAWRIVDPVLKAKTPVYEYEPGIDDSPRLFDVVLAGEQGRVSRHRIAEHPLVR